MTEREGFNLAELRRVVYTRERGVCQACGEAVPFPGELAHRIAQSKMNLEKYGKRIIHHPSNLALVCRGKPCCNDRMSIRSPMLVVKLVTKIRGRIMEESR